MRTTRPLLVLSASALLVVAGCIQAGASTPPGPTVAPTPSPSAMRVVVAETPRLTPMAATPSPDPCGTGREAMIARRVEMPGGMVIGALPAEMTTHAIGLLNGSYDGADSVPGGIGLDADEVASRARPDAFVSLAAPPANLIGAQVRLGRWSDVTFERNGTMGNPPEEHTEAIVRLEADGSASFAAPDEPGDYVVTAFIDWQTTCLEGHSFGYGRIVVR